MLALDIQRNGRGISLELPLPMNVLVGELRAIGIHEPLDKISRADILLQPTNELGEHFMRLVQIDDSLQAIATASREFEVLEGDSRQALVDLIKDNRLRDLDHMADYLQYGPDSLYGLIRMDYNGRDIVLPAPQRVLQDRFGPDKPVGEIRLAEAELRPVSEMGRQLMAAFQPYSDTIATANAACSIAQNLSDTTVTASQIVAGARKIHVPLPTETLTFIFPLAVSVVDEDSLDLVEGDPDLLAEHDEEVREALKDEVPDGDNMADHLPNALWKKIASVEWDVSYIQGKLYGKTSCELRAPLDDHEQAELTDWISGQNSDGIGEGFEQHPVDTEYQDLYVHLWHSGDDYFVLPAEEFFQRLHEQTLPGMADAQDFGGMGGMA